jgi:hypothetical protein
VEPPGRLVDGISATGAKADGSQVEITAGVSARLTIRVCQRAARIDGMALRGGKPVGGAMIVLVPDNLDKNLSRIRRDQSDSDGTFSLYNVLAGKYTVLALANGWDLEWLSPGVLEPFLKRGYPLKVSSPQVPAIQVSVQ